MPQVQALAAATDETAQAADIVERFLVASMVPDPQTAARYIADELRITFTGGREYRPPRETAAVNAPRHKWGEKKMERTHRGPAKRQTHLPKLPTPFRERPGR